MTEESRALTVRDSMDIAQNFAKSGFFSDTKEVAQAFVKIMAGQELGIPPFAAMTGVHVIQGKPAIGAGLIAGRIKGSGKYDYRVTKLDDTGCVIVFFQGGVQIGESSFTMEDAKAAGVTGNATWTKLRRNMLFARAISNGARWYTPDIFAGPVYTPEEMGVDVVDQDVIDVPATPVEQTKQPANSVHWIDNPKTRAAFWAWTENDLGIADGEVYEALGVDSVHKFAGSAKDAKAKIIDWLNAQSEPDDHADAIEQPRMVDAPVVRP